MNLHHIFPTPVALFKTYITEEEKNFIKSLPQKANTGNTSSQNSYLFKFSEMSRLASVVDDCVLKFVTSIYAPKHPVMPYVTQSWANYTKPGQFHHKHAHPNSFISGCVYISAKSDKIFFYRDGYRQIQIPTDSYNLYNSDSWWFEVNEGDIIIFPSSLTHMVETLGEKEERISISFNTFLRGKIGDQDSLTELEN